MNSHKFLSTKVNHNPTLVTMTGIVTDYGRVETMEQRRKGHHKNVILDILDNPHSSHVPPLPPLQHEDVTTTIDDAYKQRTAQFPVPKTPRINDVEYNTFEPPTDHFEIDSDHDDTTNLNRKYESSTVSVRDNTPPPTRKYSFQSHSLNGDSCTSFSFLRWVSTSAFWRFIT